MFLVLYTREALLARVLSEIEHKAWYRKWTKTKNCPGKSIEWHQVIITYFRTVYKARIDLFWKLLTILNLLGKLLQDRYLFRIEPQRVGFTWQLVWKLQGIDPCLQRIHKKRQQSFSRTHRIGNNGNIGIRSLNTWKQKKIHQQNVTPVSIELRPLAI